MPEFKKKSRMLCPKTDRMSAAVTIMKKNPTKNMDRKRRKNHPRVSCTRLMTFSPFVNACRTFDADQIRMRTESGMKI